MYQNPYYFSHIPMISNSYQFYFIYGPIQNQFSIDSNTQTKVQINHSELILRGDSDDKNTWNSCMAENKSKNQAIKTILNERNTKENIDEQYDPNSKVIGKSRKQQQNQMRNVIPNTIHQIISFIQKQSKSQGLIKKLIQMNRNQNCTVKRFFLYQRLLKERINYYVNAKTLELLIKPIQIDQGIFSKQQVLFYCKISRIMIKLFLKQQSNCLILTSSKIKVTNKILHLKAHRMLLKMLSQ